MVIDYAKKRELHNKILQTQEYFNPTMASLGHGEVIAEGAFEVYKYHHRPFIITTRIPDKGEWNLEETAMLYVSLSNPEKVAHMQVEKYKGGLDIILDTNREDQEGDFTYTLRGKNNDWTLWQYQFAVVKNNGEKSYIGDVIAERKKHNRRDSKPSLYRAGLFRIYYF